MVVSALFFSSFLALLGNCNDEQCTDNDDFVDQNGYKCKAWHAYDYDCFKADVMFHYSSEGVADLLDNCPKTCGTCDSRDATASWGNWWLWGWHNEHNWWGRWDSSDDDSCQDEKWFWDERGNRCEDWKGFVCEDASSRWHYSAKGQAKILEKCKRSCGICDGADPNCKNDYDFVDARGYSCSDWEGYDCMKSVDWGYSTTETEDILKNCRRTCNTCDDLPSLAGLVASVDDLSTLLTAVGIAGLVDTLSGEGTFTVFAPTNEAFAAIPEADLNALLADPEALKQVLLYHVLASTIVSKDIPMGETKVDTVSGGALWVTRTKNGVTVANSDRSVVANVIAADNLASNGVAHIIDAVLLPPQVTDLPTLAGLVASVDDLSTLLTAVQVAGLADTLNGEGTFTVFAPTNDAFAALPAADLNALLADPAALKQVILYHVLATTIVSGDIPMGETKVDTVSGGALWVTKSDNGVTVANSDRSVVANVIAADNLASNGVAHVIDAVLLPPVSEPLPSLAGLVASVDDLSTLLTAVDVAGLVDTLSGPGTFTVFAPTNAAFAALPAADLNALLADPEALKQVLLYHVLASTIVSGDIPVGETKVDTASGGALWVAKSDTGDVTVSNSDRSVVANVVAADNLASNGVAHVIDAVLLPPVESELPSLAGLVASVDDLSTLLTAVDVAGLVDTLSGPGSFTVFAPTNEAFGKIPAADLNALLADPEALKQVILYHVLAAKVLSTDLAVGQTKVTTVSGGALWVTKSHEGGVTVSNADRSVVANVIAADNMASNGVAHIIDAVLLPPASELPSLAGLVTSVDDLSTLLIAVGEAGLVDTLSGDGTFTVFAPNNAAFAQVPTDALNALLEDPEQLKQVILYHVLASTVLSGDLKIGETKVDTASGGALWVTKSDEGGVTVANSDRSVVANVIAADNLASNGVAHIIDAVLLPPAEKSEVISFEGFKDLCAAVDDADQCKNFGCTYNKKRAKCQIKKQNRVKCKKIKDEFTCLLVGCDTVGQKCKGTPFSS